MKKICCFCLLAFSFSICYGQAGRPYAIWEDPGLGQYKFVKLDASTGIKTDVAVLPGVLGFVGGDVTAYDAVNNYYHFAALSTGAVYRFYTIDAVSGAVIHNPVYTDILYGLEYNCADGMLYALRNTGGTYDIVRMNPVTGTAASVAAVSSMSGYVSGTASLDVALGYYSFRALISSVYYMRTYNISTGAMVATVPSPDNVVAHRYSCADNLTYGLWENAGQYKLERISPVIGTHTTVAVLAGVDPGYVVESHSVDETGYYTFRGFDTIGNFNLFTVDLSSGSVTANALTTDNAKGFEEMNCCSVPTSVNEIRQEELSLYPVPAKDEMTIEYDDGIEGIEIVAGDGKRMLMKNVSNEIKTRINTSCWPAGLYLLKVYSKGKMKQKRFTIIR